MPSPQRPWWRRLALRAASSPEARIPAVALVTGCPRSGTTALLNWVGTHPGVVVRDESRRLIAAHRFLDTVDRFTALRDARDTLLPTLRATVVQHLPADRHAHPRLLVEKEPMEGIALPDARYAEFLRHARELFPALRVVIMLRHPVATVSSMRARRWGYSLASGELRDLSVEEAIDTWRATAALAHALRDDPAVCLCRYELLAQDPATVGRAVAAHLGIVSPTRFVPSAARASVLTETEATTVLAHTAEERDWFGM